MVVEHALVPVVPGEDNRFEAAGARAACFVTHRG
jgi:hypothetical protein